MNQVERLVSQLCPNGVPMFKLGELEDSKVLKLGRGDVISKNDLNDTPGTFPVYSSSASSNGIFGRYGKFMFDDERITWSIDGGGKFFHRPSHHYSVTNVCGWLKVLQPDMLITKYIYYVLISSWGGRIYNYTVKAHPSVIREDYLIPMPPMEIQQEIVRILDTFRELEAELEAELQARKTQYEHYRNLLFSFRDTDEVGVRWIQLGDICQYRKERSKSPAGTFMYVGVEDLLQQRLGVSGDARFVSSPGHDIFMPGDVLLGNIRPYLKKVWRADVEGRTNGDVLVVTPKQEAMTELDTSYLYFLLSSDDFFGYCVQTSKGAKMPRGDKQAILRYVIPVPSIETQRQIVKALTCFESLTQDLEVGLPAEIATRRQQYEYYRNMLLTFEALESA